MVKQLFCIFLVFGMTRAVFGQAQETPKKIFIGFNTSLTVNQNDFTNTWEASPAYHLNIQLPFYAGYLEGGVRYTRFKGYAPTNTDSDFSSYYLYIGYNYPLRIASWYYLVPTLRIGNNLMAFDESESYDDGPYNFTTDQTESEFAYELALRNRFILSDHWSLNAAISYNHTFTYYPLEITQISFGIAYSFQQPAWLKDIFQ